MAYTLMTVHRKKKISNKSFKNEKGISIYIQNIFIAEVEGFNL